MVQEMRLVILTESEDRNGLCGHKTKGHEFARFPNRYPKDYDWIDGTVYADPGGCLANTKHRAIETLRQRDQAYYGHTGTQNSSRTEGARVPEVQKVDA